MINIIIYGRQKEIFKTFVNLILDFKYLLWLFLMWKLKTMFFLKLLQDLQIPWDITYNIHIFQIFFLSYMNQRCCYVSPLFLGS